jgi:hypothetical protein
MEGVEHQVAGLGHQPRGQHQSQLTGCAKPAATEGCAGAAVRNGIPTRREIAGIEAHDKSTESQASYLSSQEGNREAHGVKGAAAEAFGGVHWAVLMPSSDVERKLLKKQEE